MYSEDIICFKPIGSLLFFIKKTLPAQIQAESRMVLSYDSPGKIPASPLRDLFHIDPHNPSAPSRVDLCSYHKPDVIQLMAICASRSLKYVHLHVRKRQFLQLRMHVLCNKGEVLGLYQPSGSLTISDLTKVVKSIDVNQSGFRVNECPVRVCSVILSSH